MTFVPVVLGVLLLLGATIGNAANDTSRDQYIASRKKACESRVGYDPTNTELTAVLIKLCIQQVDELYAPYVPPKVTVSPSVEDIIRKSDEATIRRLRTVAKPAPQPQQTTNVPSAAQVAACKDTNFLVDTIVSARDGHPQLPLSTLLPILKRLYTTMDRATEEHLTIMATSIYAATPDAPMDRVWKAACLRNNGYRATP